MAAEPVLDPSEAWLVTLDHGVDVAVLEASFRALDFTPLDAFRDAGVLSITGPASRLAAAAALPGVAGIYPDEPLTPLLQRSRALVDAPMPPLGAARAGYETGRNVTIAVIDSGVDVDHPGFTARVEAAVRLERDGRTTEARDDANGHGTHVAGIAVGSGAASRDLRFAGIAADARLVAVDISDAFTTTSAVRAFRWIHEHHATYNIRVATNSWGREKDENAFDPNDPVVRAANALVADGIVVVFSAGNRGEDGRGTLTVEATNPNVIAVGATDGRGRVEAYSSRGPARDTEGRPLEWVKPDIVAPGSAIVSTRASSLAANAGPSDEERHYVMMNGTSMAAPHVAAAAALLVSRDPTLTPGVVAALLTGTARDVGGPGADPDAGHGLLDVTGALLALEASGRESRTITVRSHVPVHAEGTVTSVAGAVLVTGSDPHVPPTDRVVVPITVPAGGELLDLRFNWSSPTGGFTVTLVAPDGRRTGPYPVTDEGSVHVKTPTLVPGAWRLEAVPDGVTVGTAYEVAGFAQVLETRALELSGDHLPKARGFLGVGEFPEHASVSTLSAWLTELTAVKVLRIVVVAIGAVGMLVMGRRRTK